MKMKTHKIRGIDKSICTCEQKIAYNYAFMWHTQLKDIFNSDNIQIVKSEAYQQIINYVIRGIKEAEIDRRYNIDAIIHSFRNGIEKYMKYNNSGIIGNYEDIGKIFLMEYEIN